MGAMTRPIVILSEPTVSSYGVVGRLYHDTLTAMGVSSTLSPYPVDQPPQVPRGALVLHNTLGFRFAPAPGAVNIAVPFHEWSRYPAAWVERLNGFDAVWAASHHIARVMRQSGVTVPVRFMPPALDLHPPPIKRSWSVEGPFRMLFVGEPHFRKGHHLLIEGFRRLHVSPRRATLTVKTSAACTWADATPGVRVVAADWPLATLWRLYGAHDAFVSASLGEGLGLGAAEAILARLPVATNHWGGHTSLLTPGGYVRLAHRVVPQPYCSRPDFFAPGQQCALSSPDDVASSMEAVILQSAAARKAQSRVAREHLVKRFGFEAVSSRLRAVLAGL